MMWLTIPYIKAHSRIEFDCENELLEAYGNAAEKAILNLLQRERIQAVLPVKNTRRRISGSYFCGPMEFVLKG